MQNSLIFGEMAAKPYEMHIPSEPPKEIKMPDIRSRTAHGLTARDMEYCQTAEVVGYEVFKQQPLKKADKRTTCLKQGTAEYNTLGRRRSK